jgi:hypothetical protein
LPTLFAQGFWTVSQLEVGSDGRTMEKKLYRYRIEELFIYTGDGR